MNHGQIKREAHRIAIEKAINFNNYLNLYSDYLIKLTMQKVVEIVERVKKDNPYPDDIFQKDMFGKFGRLVWNNCCDKILKELEELI